MIRYEYEEEDCLDHKMPIVKQEENLYEDLLTSNHEWLNNFSGDEKDLEEMANDFDPENFERDTANMADFEFDNGAEHYPPDHNFQYTVKEEPTEAAGSSGLQQPYQAAVHQPHSHRSPLRQKQTTILHNPSYRKHHIIKPASQRRPIDEFQTKNGFKKPLISYSCLIGLALRNSHNGQLTVAEIYRFLCEYFPFFREAPSGWKNSVRHNLSLNKCFKKVEDTVQDMQGRKSCLWMVNPEKSDKMHAEIEKWRERCSATISLAMDDPNDLDDIVEGKKGMPPVPAYMSDELDYSPDRIMVARPATIPQTYHIVKSETKPIKTEGIVWNGHEEVVNDENSDPLSEFIPDLPADFRYPSSHPAQCAQSQQFKIQSAAYHHHSAHERAARTLESLLERKKMATVNPRKSTDFVGDIPLSASMSEPSLSRPPNAGKSPSAIRPMQRTPMAPVNRSSPYRLTSAPRAQRIVLLQSSSTSSL